ncbi:hypothetical protein [uncultured Alistipes sp.]|uniref:hypothetical protein n=1 Tax=uncultured Alistipes sp. TaxID=538949 RepID=UPI00258C9B88|nr:hypothetical protein [uncultured Alistipes sp.]
MGYVVLHLSKATGSDAGMSSHIERKIHPANADGEWFRQQRNDAIERITGIDMERNLKIKRGI